MNFILLKKYFFIEPILFSNTYFKGLTHYKQYNEIYIYKNTNIATFTCHSQLIAFIIYITLKYISPLR